MMQFLKIEKWISEIDDKEDIIAVGGSKATHPNGEHIKAYHQVLMRI